MRSSSALPLGGTVALTTAPMTSVGKKAVMALTGLVLVGFVLLHMVGNLKVFAGEAAFNAYAVGLREVGGPFLGSEQALWAVRAVLLLAVALHLWASWQLTRQSRAARPVAYAHRPPVRVGYAARTMRWGGVILLLFVVYHLLHFTFGVVGYERGQFQPLSVYKNVVLGFSVWYVALFYVAAMVALGLHLFHGTWSLFQTLGWNGPRSDRVYRRLAAVLSVGVVLGNVAVPLAVLAGVVR